MQNKALLLVSLILTGVLVEEVSSWPRIRIRLRRVWDAIKKPVCGWAVSKVCKWVGPPTWIKCDWFNKWICGKRRKRAVVEETIGKEEHLVPLPALFETYDLDGDGKISPMELALASGVDEKQTRKVAFPLCDTDGNGFLSLEEFIKSPLVVEDVGDIEKEYLEMGLVEKQDVCKNLCQDNGDDENDDEAQTADRVMPQMTNNDLFEAKTPDNDDNKKADAGDKDDKTESGDSDDNTGPAVQPDDENKQADGGNKDDKSGSDGDNTGLAVQPDDENKDTGKEN